jgi:hypothetical protein
MKRFSEIEVFDSIYTKLEEMEEQQKVDLSIINELDILMRRFKELELFWIENRKMKIDDAFILYHCARNCWNILNKMKTRFLEAHEKHLNPQVVRDSSSVISSIHTLYDLVGTPSEEPLSPEKMTLILNRLKEIRDIASNVSMLPSYQEETKDLNVLQLKKQFISMAKSLQAEFFEE